MTSTEQPDKEFLTSSKEEAREFFKIKNLGPVEGLRPIGSICLWSPNVRASSGSAFNTSLNASKSQLLKMINLNRESVFLGDEDISWESNWSCDAGRFKYEANIYGSMDQTVDNPQS
jgi:hypothetical protein